MHLLSQLLEDHVDRGGVRSFRVNDLLLNGRAGKTCRAGGCVLLLRLVCLGGSAVELVVLQDDAVLQTLVAVLAPHLQI